MRIGFRLIYLRGSFASSICKEGGCVCARECLYILFFLFFFLYSYFYSFICLFVVLLFLFCCCYCCCRCSYCFCCSLNHLNKYTSIKSKINLFASRLAFALGDVRCTAEWKEDVSVDGDDVLFGERG